MLDLERRASSYVDRILRGAKPGELPIQYPTDFELVVNLKTANNRGDHRRNLPRSCQPGDRITRRRMTDSAQTRPLALVGPHASFTLTSRHSPGQSSRRIWAINRL